MGIHHQSLVTLSRKTSVVKQLESDGLLPPNRGVSPCRSHSPATSDRGTKGRRPSRSKVPSVDQLEAVACKLEPKVEGRIMQLTPEVRRRLQAQKEADVRRLTITEVDEKSSPDDDEDRAALLGKPSKGKAIAPKKVPAKAKAKANDSSDYDSDSEDISESEGSDNLK